MKSPKFFLTLCIAVLVALAATSPADAGNITDNQALCEQGGGVWEGPNTAEGTCTLGPDTATANVECGPGLSLVTHFDELGEFSFSECVVVSGSDGSGGLGDYEHQSTQGGEENVDLCTNAGGTSRCAIFPSGTCDINCYIDPHLPTGAAHTLPGDAISTLYVNISGLPGDGPYSVCFANPHNDLLTIYRYLGGAWVALATSTANPICAGASGDGSFYLGQ